MLAAAERVFAERGYVAASMDEIAERVGVSKPMLYEYFGSKEGLMIGAIRQSRAELRAVTEEAALGATSGEEVLRRGLVAFFTFIGDHRQSWSLLRNESALIGGSASAEVEATRKQQSDLMLTLLAGYLPNTHEEQREAAAEIIVGACERLAQWCERHDGVTPEQAADYVMQLTWHGLSSLLRADSSHSDE